MNKCRVSGQRREQFRRITEEGNSAKEWPGGQPLDILQLLRDVDTRWSSGYLMIDRRLYLYPVCLVYAMYIFDDVSLRILGCSQAHVAM